MFMKSQDTTISNKQRRLTSLLLALCLLLSLLPTHAFAGGTQHQSEQLSATPVDPVHAAHMHQQQTTDTFMHDNQLDTHLNAHQQSNDCPQWLQASCIACCACPVLTTELSLILRSHPPTLASFSLEASERSKDRLERPPRGLLQII
ncbi:hypothetical protein [Nitrincola sp. MINF-07-Sa-05]|uniref:hypothetical protein n=1 Tax=Nitrincola salilacus TaxID=3400273 RepID=UPI003917FFCC